MSTMKEISESKVTVLLKPKENIAQSFFKDLVTFNMLAFCVYISEGSTWWTFITGILFLMFTLIKINSVINASTTTFKTAKEAIDYLESLEANNTGND